MTAPWRNWWSAEVIRNSARISARLAAAIGRSVRHGRSIAREYIAMAVAPRAEVADHCVKVIVTATATG